MRWFNTTYVSLVAQSVSGSFVHSKWMTKMSQLVRGRVARRVDSIDSMAQHLVLLLALVS
jgi:hypothetical protein